MKTIALIFVLAALLEIPASADPARTAEDLYTEGQAAYDRADYTTAIARWQESYQLSDASPLIFNIAQAYRLKGDCTRAIKTFERFVATDLDSTSDQHKLAVAFERELEPTCAVVAQLHPALPRTPEGPQHTPPQHLTSYAIGGVGVASMAAGLILGHHAATLGNDVTKACAISCDWSVQHGNEAAGRRDASIGYALDGLGAAAIAGSAIMYYFGGRESVVSISPRPRESGAVVSWSGSW